VASSTQTRSVKVPPMSTPMRAGLPLGAIRSPLVGAGLGRDLGRVEVVDPADQLVGDQILDVHLLLGIAGTSDHALTLSWSMRSFSDGSQKSTRLRIIITPRFRSSPTTDRMSRIENCPETSMLKFMDWISMPRPFWAPTNSATMAPMRAKIMATSSPAMTKGREFGRRSIQKICRSLAASERIRLTRSSSAERRPPMVFTSNGKKAIRAALITLEVRPSPNHTTMRGASATLGSDWNMTMYGQRKDLTRRLRGDAVPRLGPRAGPAIT